MAYTPDPRKEDGGIRKGQIFLPHSPPLAYTPCRGECGIQKVGGGITSVPDGQFL